MSKLENSNIIFDALCYLGAGSYGAFEKIVSKQVEEQWQVSIVARNLYNLGHIDVKWNSARWRPKSWSVSPPALVMQENGYAYVTGFRNGPMLTRFSELLRHYQTDFKSYKQENAPAAKVWVLDKYSSEEIEMEITKVLDPYGRPTKFVVSPAENILSYMPSIEQMYAASNQVSFCNGQYDFKFYDPETDSWSPCEIRRTGLYKTDYAGIRYFLHDEKTGSQKETGKTLGKFIAQKAANVIHHGYDIEKKYFYSKLGSELPGLFSRILVSCSGRVPTIKSKEEGLLVYENVSNKIAAMLLTKVYGDT